MKIKRRFAPKARSSFNKKGLGKFAMILIVIVLLFAAYIIYDMVSRDKTAAQLAKEASAGPQSEVTKTATNAFSNLFGIVKGFFTAAGVGPISGVELWVINPLAILLAAIIFTILLELFDPAQALIILFTSKSVQTGAGKTYAKSAVWIVLKVLVIFLLIYLLVYWIPLLRPIAAPLLSDYGHQITASYEGLVNPIAKELGREAITPGSKVWLILIKGLFFGIYAYLLYAFARAPEVVIKWIAGRYYGAKAAVQEQKANLGTMQILAGERLFKAAGQQAAK